MADDVRIFRALGVIQPKAEHVAVLCGLRTDRNQQRRVVRALGGCDRIYKVALRAAYLTHLIEYREDGRQTMSRLTLGRQCAVLHV